MVEPVDQHRFLKVIVDNRPLVAVLMVIVSLFVVLSLHFSLPDDVAIVVIDRGGRGYPLSIQNVMWVVFFVGLGELLVRYASGIVEGSQIYRGYLPIEDTTVLEAADLGAIYKRVSTVVDAQRCFLPRLIQRCILRFQTTRSVEQSGNVLTTNLELGLHEIELRYSMLRYIVWVIPSLGFIGTVIGISAALAYAGEPGRIDQPDLLLEVTRRLAVAFYTTLVALIMASILVFGASVVQSREESSLNSAGQYCFDNLINRLVAR